MLIKTIFHLFSRRVAAGALALCAAAPRLAAAQELDIAPAAPTWAFAGYGSAGLVHTNESAADFSANATNPGTAGHSRALSYDVDSRLAAQVDLTLNPQWSAVLQLVSERNLHS